MLRRLLTALFLVGLLTAGSTARAHFLFIRINEPAEAGRTVEVFFSEKADGGDPRLVAKVAAATLTLQSAPGKFQPLAVRQGADRLRGSLPAARPGRGTRVLAYGVAPREGG